MIEGFLKATLYIILAPIIFIAALLVTLLNRA